MTNQSTYRIRTKLGETEPINIPISLMQEYNSFEILSLKLNVNENYNSYTSTEGIVVGRVSTANNGLGIPNVRVSIFVPKGRYSQTDEEEVLYPFSSPTDKDGDKVRYNLLPSESDVDCYQVIGTMPTKRKVLDNETVCEVFEKYYKYTTVTNEAGDFMLTNIPVGQQRIHIDADLSDIGPFLSQRPYDMIENLGYDKNKFDSTRQFKTSKDLDSLAQVISQNKSVYVYPYWGDVTEHSSELKITRTDLSLNYEFKTSAIFIGSIITDKQSNSIRQNCTAVERAGKMSDMITGAGRIEMIRKTIDDKIEQYRVKGDALINDNGVWCYMIPMNLDYVRTDEYGNIIPTDDPNKGVPTRARVRFRISLNQMDSDEDAHKRCSYLVPNNPKITDEKFLRENDADYSFGSDTWDESFVDLFWNKVYTVKSYVPQLQKTMRSTNRKTTGVKMVNHYGDNNPFPYNGLSIKLSFTYKLLCVIVKVIIGLVSAVNAVLSILAWIPCKIASIKLLGWRPFKKLLKGLPPCIALSSEFCDDGINKNETYPGCIDCIWENRTRPKCEKEQKAKADKGEEAANCVNDKEELVTCIENQLAQQNEATSFNFSNDWINGCLYMPLWYRHIRPKKSFFFGLFKRKAKDQWCSSENGANGLYLTSFCAYGNAKSEEITNCEGEEKTYHFAQNSDGCGNNCHNTRTTIGLNNGIIVNRENIYGQKVWYYKSVETVRADSCPTEYLNMEKTPMVAKRLYATDIVLLGSMNDCDLNGVPKFYNYLKASSFNLPTDILFSDTEITFSFDKDGNLTTNSQKMSVATGCDWGNKNEYGYEDGGLFYGIGCSQSSIDVSTPSCINLRRICELGVGLDEMQYVENIKEASINSENDELDLNNLDNYLRPDGFISYDDIIDFNYRSMFATMNGNGLKTKINTTNGTKEYDLRPFYIDNFDGSLFDFMRSRQTNESKANYKYNYNLEKTNEDYLLFRYGNNPYFYDGKNVTEENAIYTSSRYYYSFPKFENSFYFYFGLKEGKTAIDLFNEQYNGPCATKTESEESINYIKSPNSWCCVDSDENGTYNHKTYDGYFAVNLEDIPLPCSMILNSKVNSSISYTVAKLDSDDNVDAEDTTVTNSKFCFYGDQISKEVLDETLNGYDRYGLLYENSVVGEEAKPSYMLTNGEYTLYITDGEGNQHSYVINIKGKYLEFNDIEQAFAQPNNVLAKYYKYTGEKYDRSPYNSIAKSPTTKKGISFTISDTGQPIIKRNDVTKSLVIKDTGIPIELNGTICLYNVSCNNKELENFVIEVEPYEKDTVGNYSDEDFWKSAEETDKTWYEPKLLVLNGKSQGSCTLNEQNGKIYVIKGSASEYFFVKEKNDAPKTNVAYYVIKCPKGGVDYRVTITQLCSDENGKWFKSTNSVNKEINVAEPTPYKLYINDVDYDVIKNFKTGYALSTSKHQQNLDGSSSAGSPFMGFTKGSTFANIKGWLQISDLKNEFYDWSVDEKKFGPSSLNTMTRDDVTMLSQEVEELEEKVAKFEQKLTEIDPAEDPQKYENTYNEYQKTLADYTGKSTTLQYLNNRLEFIDKVKSAFWIQCPDEEKTISIGVTTDDTPYDICMIYNEEFVCENNDDYNETNSTTDKAKRDQWYCTGTELTSISGIKNPTITSYDSADFGIANDGIRQTMTTTYNSDKTICFAQDNVAENSEDGGISIKPPYLIACVNNKGVTKPEGLTQGKFFGKKENGAGVETYRFRVAGEGYVKSGTSEFFGFHLIDKIFTSNVVCWAYHNNVPCYLPWYDYDTKPDDSNKIGYSITVEGILSGNINNGISSATDKDTGCVSDFDDSSIFSKTTPIKTFENDTEDSIPTRRCILYSDIIKYDKDASYEDAYIVNVDIKDYNEEVKYKRGTKLLEDKYNELSEDDKKKCIKYDLIYKNYRFTDEVDRSAQYRLVPNKQGTLLFSDDNCEVNKTLYGSMRVRLLSTSNTGENDLTLNVSCSNGDTENPIKYYLFKASQNENLGNEGVNSNNVCWYPLNAFTPKRDEKTQKVTYIMDCNPNGIEPEKCVWSGTKNGAPYAFNKNTTESKFRDKTVASGDSGNKRGDEDLACYTAWSQVPYTDSEGTTQYTKTWGYGTTGSFKLTYRAPYFVVAVTADNCRAISPVFDFHTVYYNVGVVNIGEKYYLRIAPAFVLCSEGCTDGAKADADDNYGIVKRVSNFKKYCKKPRNYYLTQYDFTMSYTFTTGSVSVSESDIEYNKKTELQFVDTIEKVKDPKYFGYSYIKEDETSKTYTLYTNVGGQLIEGEASRTPIPKPEEIIENGTYWYVVYDGSLDADNNPIPKYQEVTISEYGLIEKSGYPSDIKPTGTILDSTHYVKYEEEVENANEKVTWKYYVPITYSMVTEESGLHNDPRTPYFMQWHDKEIEKAEYDALGKLFNNKAKGRGSVHIIDVTGLDHYCYICALITKTDDWNKWAQVSSE